MEERATDMILASLPECARAELMRLARERGGLGSLSELRLRAVGISSAVLSGERVRLLSPVGREALARVLEVLTGGALYSHRDTICRGYLSLPSGVRVGVSGSARYDGERLVGISDISSLVFRIPTGAFDARAELYSAFVGCRHGILIYSPPGLGKTSALRALARDLGERGEEVAVVAERFEFTESEYQTAAVDLLRGYRRSEGIEIALRTLSPTAILVDEVGRLAEAESMLEALSSGVRVAVTAHAGSEDEVRNRVALKPFFEHGAVDVLVGINMREGKRVLSVTEV